MLSVYVDSSSSLSSVSLGCFVEDQLKIRLGNHQGSIQTVLAFIEQSLVSLQPQTTILHFDSGKESLLSYQLDKITTLIKDLTLTDALLAPLESGSASYESVKSLLGRFLVDENQTPTDPGYLKTLRGLISILSSDSSLFRSVTIDWLPSKSLKLDKACNSALNLFGDSSSKTYFSRSSSTSVFDFLKKTKTPFGAKLLESWILAPSTCPVEISSRHNVVEFFVRNELTRQRIQQFLSRLNIFESRTHKLRKKTATVDDLSGIADDLDICFHIKEGLKEKMSDFVNDEFVLKLEKLLESGNSFQAMMETAFERTRDNADFNGSNLRVAESFDARLKSINQRRHQILQKIDDERLRVQKKFKVDNVKFVDTPSYGFRVVKKFHANLQGSSEIHQIQLNKAEFVFGTDLLSDLVESFVDVEKEYEDIAEAVIKKVTEVGSTYIPLFLEIAGILAKLDVLCGFGEVSSTWKFVRPVISEQGSLNLVGLRHPLIEARLLDSYSKQSFIANDFNAKGQNLMIITGPNMSGKSSYIRSVALAVVFNQLGCFVPAQHAEMKIFKELFCRIGASDDSKESTFFKEMKEAADILSASTSDSIVLIDELGRGTSTAEGFGLAWAIAAALQQKQSLALFATHFSELSQVPNALNFKTTALVDENQVKFKYEIVNGIAEESYGVHVAKLAGFPEEVVNSAEILLRSA
jgi:DNA mismatch repair protein MSH2